MKITISKESLKGETRVAMTPDAVKRLVSQEIQIAIESGAGDKSYYPDSAFASAGAQVAESSKELYQDASIVLRVHPPEKQEISSLPENAVLISFLNILRTPELAKELAAQKVTSFAMEMVPRISRAQSMDALSSQASAAGYKAVIVAAKAAKKFFPMLTTAAGTIAPAKVFIIGAGVAGLQAIATAKRLGAVVEAFDIRAAAKGEVESLGAKFVQAQLEEDTEAEGGYAKEVSNQGKEKIQETIHQHVAAADVVITTAQVPGKKAPLLVTREMIQDMKPGSVVVDMAVEQGGNCDLSESGKEIDFNGVTIIGPENLPADMAMHTSQMYARNLTALLKLLIKENSINLDFEDEIIKGCCITHAGEIVHPRVKELL